VKRGTLQDALSLITKARRDPTLAAVDGYSASGKSTLARALLRALEPAYVVHGDDFYRPMDETVRSSLGARAGYLSYYDLERLEAQVLRPLSQGVRATYQKYDWETNRLGAWETVPPEGAAPEGVFIVEGLYVARPDLRPYYDVVLWVETPRDLRWKRQLARNDAPRAWLERWDAAERYYDEHTQPAHRADLVISGL